MISIDIFYFFYLKLRVGEKNCIPDKGKTKELQEKVESNSWPLLPEQKK